MRLLVTGGTGFLGRRVVADAVRDGHHVVGLARGAAAAQALERAGAQVVAGDLDDPASVDAAFQAAKGDVLVNLASLGFGHADVIVSAAEATGLHRAIFISTTAIFTTLPAATKRIRTDAEKTITSSGLDWTILRPAMIYGGLDDRNMARLLAVLRRSPLLPLPGGGSRLQQPVHVDDLAAAVLAAARLEVCVGRVYNLAGPEALTFRTIVAEAAAAVGRRVVTVPLPLRATLTVARGYERLAARPRLRAEQIARLAEDKAFPITDAAADLGFAPRPFARGIQAEAALLAEGRR
ncbi:MULTISPECIES: SDR family oxidoreductase [Protofrankia]|uniref:NAD-dependent epimerase/dehydratase n=1 Tax=Candidatus Protofrankia datiscae TaxID=2716812 RepID=F8B3G4_9ACTN|nr:MULTISPECIES: SDR family NAD(P)-dependent oxidoreductase [Protofrankia]AEH09137.1 NAD-dependent epimerase/dehydratase [Candidatus Protofrankia datiscae]